jgi:hypothetical protein
MRVGLYIYIEGELSVIIIDQMDLGVLDLLPEHRQTYEGGIYGKTP